MDKGFLVGSPMELQKGPAWDVHSPRFRRLLVRWLRMGLLWYVHLATPCTPWSQARPARQTADTHVLDAGRHTVSIIRLLNKYQVYWSLENPSSSRLWRWGALEKCAGQPR